MADIITLKDLKTDETVYPRTHVSAVIDSTNTPLDSLLQANQKQTNEKFASMYEDVEDTTNCPDVF